MMKLISKIYRIIFFAFFMVASMLPFLLIVGLPGLFLNAFVEIPETVNYVLAGITVAGVVGLTIILAVLAYSLTRDEWEQDWSDAWSDAWDKANKEQTVA